MLRKGLAVLRMRSVSGLGKARHSEGPPAGALAAGWSAPHGHGRLGAALLHLLAGSQNHISERLQLPELLMSGPLNGELAEKPWPP